MGQAGSKKSHVSAQASANIRGPATDTNYSLTFTGHVVLNTPRKSKNISYSSVCKDIMNDPRWDKIIKESMRNSILCILQKNMGEEFYSSEYPPVTDISFAFDNPAKNDYKMISGTLYWKSILTDFQGLAECIATILVKNPSLSIIKDSQKRWVYHYIPGRLSDESIRLNFKEGGATCEKN
jgi:hypothetical protein